MSDLKVYWWKSENKSVINLGDEISGAICSYAAKRPVSWAPLDECDMVSIGSILAWPFREQYIKERKTACHVWGSGLMSPETIKQNEKIHVHSVRGYLTKCMVDTETDVPIGDPGILVADIWEPSPTKKYKIGIIPHKSQIKKSMFHDLHAKLNHSVFIDLTNPDVPGTLDLISSCEYVMSTSLHGLIIADAYKIPNIWMKTPDIHKGKSWKFYDYFSSIGRPHFRQVYVQNHVVNINRDKLDVFLKSQHENVDQLKRSVLSAFPKELSAR